MITFASENIEMPALSGFDYRDWIRRVAESHGRIVGDVGYMFCDDTAILDYNRRFLGHDYYTDVITFHYNEGRRINGDIVISLETVRTNAEKYSQPYSDELDRVIIHGILHLCGIDDKGPDGRGAMEAAENAALAARHTPDGKQSTT